MMRFTIAVLLASVSLWGQPRPCSARAIFIGDKGAIPPGCAPAEAVPQNPQKTETSGKRPPVKNTDSQGPVTKPSQPAPVPVSYPGSEMSAMMYWIELVQPNGETQRVTTDRVFLSGERIRLHFQSSIAGRLTIAMVRPDGSSRVLFPDSRINAGDNLIQAKVDTPIPPSGYFRFDTETGTDRLMVFLHPGITSGSDRPMTAGSILDRDQTTELARNISSKRGLILETVDQPGHSAQYVAAAGVVALEIRLKHQ